MASQAQTDVLAMRRQTCSSTDCSQSILGFLFRNLGCCATRSTVRGCAVQHVPTKRKKIRIRSLPSRCHSRNGTVNHNERERVTSGRARTRPLRLLSHRQAMVEFENKAVHTLFTRTCCAIAMREHADARRCAASSAAATGATVLRCEVQSLSGASTAMRLYLGTHSNTCCPWGAQVCICMHMSNYQPRDALKKLGAFERAWLSPLRNPPFWSQTLAHIYAHMPA